MKQRLTAVAVALMLFTSASNGQSSKKTYAEIRQLIIKESIAGYGGSCRAPKVQIALARDAAPGVHIARPEGNQFFATKLT